MSEFSPLSFSSWKFMLNKFNSTDKLHWQQPINKIKKSVRKSSIVQCTLLQSYEYKVCSRQVNLSLTSYVDHLYSMISLWCTFMFEPVKQKIEKQKRNETIRTNSKGIIHKLCPLFFAIMSHIEMSCRGWDLDVSSCKGS